ncbi:MAG: NADH:flavin oxidoreductase, partial [Hyphomicrobiales bacterium]
FYMGGVLAELLVQEGCAVSLVTPAAEVSQWTNNTLEQAFIQRKLIELGVDIHVTRAVSAIAADHVTTECTYSGRESRLEADAVVLVTSRTGNDRIWQDLKARRADWADAGIKSALVIGDAEAPAPIAWATYAGRRYAEELDSPEGDPDALPFRREIAELAVD